VSATPFEYLHHLVTVPVVVDGEVETRFVLDTGIGLTLVTEEVGEAIGLTASGSRYTGRRMSGQDLTLPLATVGSLSLGTLTRDQHTVGILDTRFPEELSEIGGFLSLAFFAETPVTVDYPRGEVVLETEESLAARVTTGTALDVRIRRDGPALDLFLPFTIPGRGSIEVEVDMGSDSLILAEQLAGDLGVRLDDPTVRRVDGTDEMGHAYTRYFTSIDGAVHPTGAPELCQVNPDVMLQRIVYDGLVGDAFLRNFVVTYDVGRARMIFAQPA
jgi:Aspartyl protease